MKAQKSKKMWEGMEEKKKERIQKHDSDFVYLDGAFCAYILDQTNYVKGKAELIENLVKGFYEKLDKMPVGMIPSPDLINEFSKAINYLEKAHTRLAIELMRLKGMAYMNKITEEAYMDKEETVGEEDTHDPMVN